MEIDSKVKGLNYWLSHCNGVKNVKRVTMFYPNHIPRTTAKNTLKLTLSPLKYSQ